MGWGAIVLAAWLAVPFAQTPTAALMHAVDARYNALYSLQADFTEIYSAGLGGRTESGTLYLRKPGRMRWEYRNPAKLFLVEGHNVWLYVPGDGQAQHSSLKSSTDLRTPLRFLLGHTDLERELADVGYGELDPLAPGDLVLHGQPIQLRDLYREVWLEVTPAYLIQRIRILALDGSITDIQLSQIKINVPLPDALFQFKPPAGVRVVETPATGQ